MPKRISNATRKKDRHSEEHDLNRLAHNLVQLSVSDQGIEAGSLTKAQVSQLMSQMGRKGGKIGGKRRLLTMTPEQRSQSALRAAHARWKKQAQ